MNIWEFSNSNPWVAGLVAVVVCFILLFALELILNFFNVMIHGWPPHDEDDDEDLS